MGSIFYKTLLTGMVAMVLPLSMLAQSIRLERVSADPGLSQNTVHCLLQDRLRFIWVGTADGLNRFDGYGFVHFKNRQDNPASISNNFINELCQDRNGYIWVATYNGLNRFDPYTETFQRFFADPARPNSLADKQVHAVFEDRAGTLWVGAGTTLHQLEPTTGTFKRCALPVGKPRFDDDNSITSIAQVGDDLLVATWGSGIWRFRQRDNSFSRVQHNATFLPKQNWVENVWTDTSGTLWAIINGLAFRYDSRQRRFIQLVGSAGDYPRDINAAFVKTADGRLLAGISNLGLKAYDKNLRETREQFSIGSDALIGSNYRVTTILQGEGGAFWVGTQEHGLLRYDPEQYQFQTFAAAGSGGAETPDIKNVSGIAQTAQGTIWVASSTDGIAVFDPKSQKYSAVRNYPALKSDHLSCIFEDSRGHLWVGTWGGGVAHLSPDGTLLNRYLADAGRSNALGDIFICSIIESNDRHIWIATTAGVSVIAMDAATRGIFKNYAYQDGTPSGLCHFQANVVYCDHAGRIWIGTKGGLNLYLPDKDAFQHFQHDPSDPATLGSNRVVSLFEDSKKRLWVGTLGGGLHLYEPNKRRFVHFTEQDGLVQDAVVGIVEDKRGHLWVSTGRGLSRFDPERRLFTNYFRADGLPADQFVTRSIALCQNTGQIMAWSGAGLALFHPDSLRPNRYVPPVVISSVKKHLTEGKHTDIVSIPGAGALEHIELPFSENTLTFEFAALNFRRTAKNQYAYKLEGLGQGWTQLGNKRTVTFSDIPLGRYTLRVKGSNNDGIWNERGAVLQVTILPPWYRSWWAYALYALAVGGVVYWLLHKQREAQRLQQRLEREQFEAEQLKALDAAKSRLYTNISHEFRTPLTVILGMAGQVEQNPQARLHEGLALIRRNGQNLLTLINQLLDLAKLEARQMPVHFVQGDIVPFLRYVAESFQSMAETKDIALRFSSERASITMDYDPGKMQQILSNLLANAIKFTPEGGVVTIFIMHHASCIILKVTDTGIGIAPEQLPHIFDRFYQADGSDTRGGESTGIGLALVQELVGLLGGHISAESKPGQGSTFTVQLPITRTAPMDVLPAPLPLLPVVPFALSEKDTVPVSHTDTERPLLLIVEDNADVRAFLVRLLEQEYRLETAENGQIGIDLALEIVPDLIISDVMMPEKDGFDLCDALKNDVRTSHIPIILLTARAEAAARLEGLRRGADAYLSKPFHEEELLLLLAQQLTLRRRLMERYAALQLPEAKAASSEAPADTLDTLLEDTFFKQVLEAGHAHLADADFGGEELARMVFLSVSQLNRKLNALTGKSSVQFLRDLRLRRAQELLQQTDLPVTAVADAVGFHDASYFGRVFAREFGATPSEWRMSGD